MVDTLRDRLTSVDVSMHGGDGTAIIERVLFVLARAAAVIDQTDPNLITEQMLAHRYVTPKRYDDPQPGPLAERDWDHIYVDDSWDEVQKARTDRLLSDDEYREVSKGLDERHRAST
jgi:hypothetical protein